MTNSKITTVTDVKSLALERGWNYEMAEPATRQRQDISRTIEEEIIDFLDHTYEDVDRYIQIYGVPREGRLKHNSRIHAVYEYDVPETFTCTIPCASVVHGDGLIMTEQHELLVQSMTQRSPLQIRYVFAKDRVKPEQVFSPGKHVSLLCYAAYNYYHWSLDALLRLALFAADDTSFKVIVPAVIPRFTRQILELLHISEDRVVVMRDQELVVDELLFAYPEESPAKAKLTLLLEQRSRLSKGAGVDPSTTVPHRRLYISRAHSARPIVNEDELLPILRHHGFEIIFSEQLTVAEQIALFAEASCIVGAHGAGLTNVMFAQPGTIIIEIFNRLLWFDCYHKLSSLMGHQHWHLFAENLDEKTWTIRVDPRRLDKLLTYALR